MDSSTKKDRLWAGPNHSIIQFLIANVFSEAFGSTRRFEDLYDQHSRPNGEHGDATSR